MKKIVVMLIVFIVNRSIHILLPNLRWLKFVVILLSTSVLARIFYNVKFYKGIIVAILYSVLSAILEMLAVLILNPFGFNSFANVDTPAASPPPPIGTKMYSTNGSSLKISMAILA